MFIVGKTRENDRVPDDFFFFKKIKSRIMKKIAFKSLKLISKFSSKNNL